MSVTININIKLRPKRKGGGVKTNVDSFSEITDARCTRSRSKMEKAMAIKITDKAQTLHRTQSRTELERESESGSAGS